MAAEEVTREERGELARKAITALRNGRADYITDAEYAEAVIAAEDAARYTVTRKPAFHVIDEGEDGWPQVWRAGDKDWLGTFPTLDAAERYAALANAADALGLTVEQYIQKLLNAQEGGKDNG